MQMKAETSLENCLQAIIHNAIRPASIIFILAALTSSGVALHEALDNGWFSARCIILILLYIFLLLLAFVRIRGRHLIFLASFVVLFPLYAFETYITIVEPQEIRKASQNVYGKVRELRNLGIEAHPFLYPFSRILRHYDVQGQKYFPLAGIGNATTVLCQEAGPFLVYESDRYGFNNPKNAWDAPVQVALLGDSLVHGMCVEPHEHISEILREKISGVVNLGMAGSGPLLKLANIREHLAHEKPRYVFWNYSEGGEIYNWLLPNKSELKQELRDTILPKYLNKDFSQNLRKVRPTINEKLITFSNDRYLNLLNAPKPLPPSPPVKKNILVEIRNWMTLTKAAETTRKGIEMVQLAKHSSLNERGSPTMDLGRWLAGIQDPERNKGVDVDKNSPLPTYRSILHLAKEEVESWGGELVFVYLSWIPSYKSPYRMAILEMVKEEGIKMIDSRPEFVAHQTPSDIFAVLGGGTSIGHYSPIGYKIISKKMIKFLKNENAIR